MITNIPLQPKQKIAFYKSLETPVLFYGGAKGGGKSFLIRAREVYRRLTYPGTKGLIVRKTYPELLSNHIRKFFVEYPSVRDWFNKGEKAIYWPNGSITEFSFLGTTDDVYTYQGREYEDISIDEITQHEEEVFKILRTSNRTTNPNIKPSMFLTGNPGGIGHAWAKRIFVDRDFKPEEDPNEFGFVQAKVYDNRALLDADPAYLKRLLDLPEAKRKAYLEGDWNVFEGAVFSEFSNKHVTEIMFPKSEFKHYLGIDWGYSGRKEHKGAFAAYAMALVEEHTEEGEIFHRVIVYQEWYDKYKTPEEWAVILRKHTQKFTGGRGDSSMFNPTQDGSISIAERMQSKWNKKSHWLKLKKGTRNRQTRIQAMHDWLKIAPDGLPYMLITENCKHLIRTLPLLIYDKNNPEDVDTTQEDHPWDGLTYMLSEIKYIPANMGAVEKYRPKTKKYLPAIITALDLESFESAKPQKGRWQKA